MEVFPEHQDICILGLDQSMVKFQSRPNCKLICRNLFCNCNGINGCTDVQTFTLTDSTEEFLLVTHLINYADQLTLY